MLRVSEKSVCNGIKDGSIPCIRLGRRLLVPVTKSDAQRALREAISATEQGTFIEPSKMRKLETSTIESYERDIRVHVLPRIGGIKLQQLGAIHLLAVRTVRFIHTIISRSLKAAVKIGLVNDNIARNASPPRKPKAKTIRPMWTAEQTRTFLDWAGAEQHRLWVAWAFIATSGDRRGANLGLHWHEVDFDRGTAALTWTVTCVNHELALG